MQCIHQVDFLTPVSDVIPGSRFNMEDQKVMLEPPDEALINFSKQGNKYGKSNPNIHHTNKGQQGCDSRSASDKYWDYLLLL